MLAKYLIQYFTIYHMYYCRGGHSGTDTLQYKTLKDETCVDYIRTGGSIYSIFVK